MLKYVVLLLLSVSCLQALAQHDVPPTTEFKISGAVKKTMTVTSSALQHMPQDAIGDVMITNHRGDPKTTLKQLKGILLKTLLDSAGIISQKPKDLSELMIRLTASDGYKNVYSWNELFNTEVGNHVYIITSADGKPIDQVDGRILVLSLSDIVSGRRHLKGLAAVEVVKM
jgi:hypothetical protein